MRNSQKEKIHRKLINFLIVLGSTLPTPSAQAVAVASAALASSGATLQASSISKIAHSAENLIDTIKNVSEASESQMS